jgi:hypothetical protein
MDDLRIVATRIWDLLGRRPCTSADLSEALFARLRWFPPSDSERLVRTLLQAGLFVPGPSSGTWVGAKELDEVAVPLTYRPPPDLPLAPASAPAPLLDRVLGEVARGSHEPLERLRTEAAQVARELGVEGEAAAMLVGWRRGMALPKLREELRRAWSGPPPAR